MAKPTTDTGKPAEKKSPIEFLKDSWFVISVVFAIGTALAAGWLPARRAARIRIFEALAYE